MSTDSRIDLTDVLACVLFVGVGLTSLALAIWPQEAVDYHASAAQLIEVAAVEQAEPPEELLIHGVALEELLFEGLGELAAAHNLPLRLISSDDEADLVPGRYWVMQRETTASEAPEAFATTSIGEHDGLKLSLWSDAEAGASIHLSERVRSARAAYVPLEKGPTISCTRWRFGRMFCGPNNWNWVGSTEVHVGGAQKRCIWAHPLSGHELQIVFSNVRLTGALRGGYGLADSAIGQKQASPVTFRVLVDGEERVKRVVPNKGRWNSFSIPPAKDPTPVDLTFVVTAPRDGRRHFCFDGEIVPPREK